MQTLQTHKTVFSKPDRLLWYHWACIVLGSAWFVLVCATVYYEVTHGSYRHAASYMFLYCGIWYYTIARLFFKRPLLEFTDTHILNIDTRTVRVTTPFPIEFIQKALKRSPHCYGFFLKEDSPVTFQTKATEFKLQEFTINGNERDLQQLAEALTANKILVSEDPIPDNDPTKQAAVLGISVVTIIAFITTVIFLVSQIRSH